MKADALYNDFIQNIKKHYPYLKIMHRNMKYNHGLYYHGKSIILSNCNRGTIVGLCYLFHEYKHHLDFINKRYKYFYNYEPFPDSWSIEQKINYVFRVEWNCFNYAKNQLKKYNFPIDNLKILNKEWVKKNLLPIWIKYYKIK